MAKNETWDKRIIDGKEKMLLVSSVEVPDPVVEESLEDKVKRLEATIASHAVEIEKLKKKS